MLVGPDADLEGEPRVVVKGALAWQAAAAPGGVMLGVVLLDDKAQGTGPVELVSLDGAGAAVGKPIVVSDQPTAQADLDMTRIGDRIVLAWTDRRTLDPRVTVAVVDGSGGVVAKPELVLPPRGEQSVVRLVPPVAGQRIAYLAWEDLLEETTRGRRVLLATIDEDGKVGPLRGEIVIADANGGVPELVATARGVAALTLAPACPKGACQDPEVLPTFVEVESDFATVASEPIRLQALGGVPAPLAWGLSCDNKACMALAAKESLPTPVYAVKLVSRSAHWEPAGGPHQVPSPPRLDALRTLALGDELADVAALSREQGALVATVTYFDPNLPYERLKKPAPDGRYDPTRALVQTQVISADGSAAEPKAISIRARCVGGVDLATAPNRGALLAWSAIDGANPQVFVTLLNAQGGRLLQRMLTRGRGEVADVAVAEVGDGWIVGWVSERDGDPEVYAAKIDRALRRVGKEQRITNAAGTATGLRLASKGESVLAAWSDARGPKGTSLADVFAIRLSAKDASPMGGEVQIAETRWHSHSPVFAACGDSTVLGWVESTGMESTSSNKGTGVRLVEMDETGHPRGNIVVGDGQNVASGLSLGCSRGHYRGVFAVRTAQGRELRGFDWSAESEGEPRVASFVGLRGPTEQPLPTALAGDRLFYADLAESRGRLMMMDLAWN
jgi:hypothetical protein